MSKFRRTIIPVAILAFSIAVFVLMVKTKPEATVKPVEERQWLVHAETIKYQTSQPTLLLFGRIESSNRSLLTSSVEADVSAIRVQEGKAVNKNDVVIKLNLTEARLRLEQTKSSLEEIRANIESEKQHHKTNLQLLAQEKELLTLTSNSVDRMRSLKEQKLGSTSQLEELQQARVRQAIAVTNREHAINDHKNRIAQLNAKYEQARSRYELAQLDLQHTEIRAPFTGSVSDIKVAVGERVRPGTPVAELIENRMEIRTQIPSNRIQEIRKALTSGTLSAQTVLDDTVYQLSLTRLSAKLEAGKGVADAFLTFDDNNIPMQDGRVIEVLVQLPPVENVITLPRESLYGMDTVYKIENERLKAVRIDVIGEKRELKNAGVLLIKSSELKPGEHVLVTKFANAIEGLRVKVQ